jgi:signal transduction histidine kinase
MGFDGKTLTKIYLLAFGTIFGITLIAQLMVQYFIVDQKDYSRVINLAGRQRMLSQKIAKDALLLSQKYDKELSKKLRKNAELFKTSHKNLMEGNAKENLPAPFNDELKKMYGDLDSKVQTISDDAICLSFSCKRLIDIQMLNKTADQFLVKMNEIVFLSDEIVKGKVKNLSLIELSLFALIIFVMAYEFFKVILPIKKTLQDQIRELHNQEAVVRHNYKLASLGQLAAGIGHEINNPLMVQNSIIYMLRDILKSSDPKTIEKTETEFHKLEVTISRISNIVQGLRSFSRQDSDKTETFNLVKDTSESILLLEDIYKKEKVIIESDFQKESIMLHGNRGRLQQVIVNLLSNAKDAFESKPGEIKVSIGHDDECIEIKIADNGMGIKEEIRKKIFDPFYTTKGVGKGTGIGLSLTHKIIKEHNGSIDLQSTEGEGTTFILKLPFDAEINKKDQTFVKKEQPVTITKSTKNIIVVDDEEAICDILRITFTDAGFNCVSFLSPIDAIEYIKQNTNKIDFIFSDVQMPDMTGDKFLNEIVSQNIIGDTHFYFVTGGIKQFEVDDNLQTYIKEIIYKPFNVESMIEIVKGS